MAMNKLSLVLGGFLAASSFLWARRSQDNIEGLEHMISVAKSSEGHYRLLDDNPIYELGWEEAKSQIGSYCAKKWIGFGGILGGGLLAGCGFYGIVKKPKKRLNKEDYLNVSLYVPEEGTFLISKKEESDALRNRMRVAIEEEDYELARELKNEIEKLEEENNG